jgi:hypothetical protein
MWISFVNFVSLVVQDFALRTRPMCVESLRLAPYLLS